MQSKRSLKQQKSCIATLEKVNSLCQPLGEHTNTVGAQSPTKSIHNLKVENENLKKKVKQTTQKYWNARRWNLRLEKAAAGCKVDLKQAKIDAAHMRGVMNMLGKDLEDLRATADESILLLQARIKALVETQRDLTSRRVILWKRCRRLEAAKRSLKKWMQERAKLRPTTFRIMHKGRYTPAARSLACLMVSNGTTETKVGNALIDIGNALGISVDKRMNKCSVQRCMLEQGVAADIQLVYEILKSGSKSYLEIKISVNLKVFKDITYSSDSTSHKHIEYECRTIALEVTDYSNPSAACKWKSRTLGIGISTNHAS